MKLENLKLVNLKLRSFVEVGKGYTKLERTNGINENLEKFEMKLEEWS